MRCERIVRRGGAAHAQRGPHGGRAGGIELCGDVRDEEDLFRRVMECRGDFPITAGVPLWSSRCVEVTGQERRQVTGGCVGEEIALRLDASGREDGDLFAAFAPTLERRSDVRIDVTLALQLARPDLASSPTRRSFPGG